MDRFTCPCGRVYLIMLEEERKMKKGLFARLPGSRRTIEFESDRYWQPSLTAPVAAPLERSPIMERHVRLTLVQSLICGFFATALPLVIALFASDDWRVWLATVICFFLVGSGVAWFLLFFKDRQLLWAAEKVLGVDLNRDGRLGEPEVVRGEITDRDRHQTTRVEFPFPPDKLREVARAILHDDHEFSRRGLADIITENQFHTLQREFLKRGLCYWKHAEAKTQGVGLAPGGRAFLRLYVK